ncbi:hypothetical protein MJH12_07010, partial [bacterium]|nr:hypothetical protein [bacterium]
MNLKNNTKIKAMKLLVIPFACAMLCTNSFAGVNGDASGASDQATENTAGLHAQQTLNAANLANEQSAEDLQTDAQLIQTIGNNGGVIPTTGGSSVNSSPNAASSSTNEGAEEGSNEGGTIDDIDPKKDVTAYVERYLKDTQAIEAQLDQANLAGDTALVAQLGPEYKTRMFTMDRIGKDLAGVNDQYNGRTGIFFKLYSDHIKGNNYSSTTKSVLDGASPDPDQEILAKVGFPITGGGSSEGGSDTTTDVPDTGTPDTGTPDEGETDGEVDNSIAGVCGGNYGGNNGAKKMMEKLNSAECQAALEANPSLKSEASVDQALKGLERWQSVVNSSTRYYLTIKGIGIENLRKLGIHIFSGKSQSEVDSFFGDPSEAVKA